jgi:CelD/BcsL family acetyltransferase involved in cellulose biosynthesis
LKQARTSTSPLDSGTGTTLVEIDPVRDPRWDALVRRHRAAGAYHLGAWAEILRSAYGYRACYLGLEAPDGTLLGGLPLMSTRGPVTGRRVRTLPVVPPAGPLADSDEDMRALLEAACRRTDAARAKVWTLHSRQGGLDRVLPELCERPKNPTFVLPLDRDPDEIRADWKKSASNLFRSVKKAEKAGVTVREAASLADVRAFYALYARTMRRRRVVPRPYRQIKAAYELLPEGVFRMHLAEHEGRIVAGSLWHSFGGTLDLLYNGSDERRLDCRPNHALYWHALRWGAESGHTELDFGPAKLGSGLADFKQQWSAEPVCEYRFDYAPGGAYVAEADEAVGPSKMAEGRESTSLVARAIERAPLRLLGVAGRLAYRL